MLIESSGAFGPTNASASSITITFPFSLYSINLRYNIRGVHLPFIVNKLCPSLYPFAFNNCLTLYDLPTPGAPQSITEGVIPLITIVAYFSIFLNTNSGSSLSSLHLFSASCVELSNS